MKKKQIANLVMVAVILAIATAGILGVGYIRGWFDGDDGNYAVLGDVRGVVNLERNGVSYPVENETVLRAGDKLSCDPGATAVIRTADGTFTVGEKASVVITEPAAEAFSAELLSGEMFAHCGNAAVITFSGKKAELSQATALFSIRAGAQSISVLQGQVGDAAAGQILNYVADEGSVSKLDIHSLNDFGIAQIRKYDGGPALCFTSEDLDLLVAERQQAIQELISSQIPKPGTETTDPEPTGSATGTGTPSTEEQVPPAQSGDPVDPVPDGPTADTQAPEADTNDPATEATTAPPVAESPTETPTTAPETPPATSDDGSCTIMIRCDTILSNMDDLEPGKAEFVPEDGVILYPVTVDFTGGETVFHVLKRVCDIAGIQLEYSWTPLYDSYYIEGINHLYEFDCGMESGWMYKVNGWFPNYGCSSYTLKDGDVIVWSYTCRGLGTDVGAPEWTD